jgi:putative heme-binding domain-containing protein
MFEETVYQPQQVLDVAAGQKVFEASCASCHRVGSLGNDHGVAGLNLTGSKLRTSKHALLEAVFFPNRAVPTALAAVEISTTDGRKIDGVVVSESGQSLSLLTAAGTTVDVARNQVKSRRQTKTSIMPEGLAESIDRAGLRNLAAFLAEPSASGGGAQK